MDRASIAHGKDNGNVCKILIVRPQCRRPLGRRRLRCPDNIKMDINGISCEDVKWIHVHQDRVTRRALGKAIMNPRVL